MNFKFFFLLLSSSLSLAYFILEYPESRGFDEERSHEFPCGGHNTVSPSRTRFPFKGGAIGLIMGDHESQIEVLIAFSSAPTTEFNTVLRPTFSEKGFGRFCMIDINMPENLELPGGTNATIQVITNTNEGVTYSCADISFDVSAFVYAICTNSTGVTLTDTDFHGNANKTTSSASSSRLTRIWGYTYFHQNWITGLRDIVIALAAIIFVSL